MLLQQSLVFHRTTPRPPHPLQETHYPDTPSLPDRIPNKCLHTVIYYYFVG